MLGLNFDDLSSPERLIAEQAIVNFRALIKACREAPRGKILAAETLAMDQGRELTRRTLQESVNQQCDEIPQKFAEPGLSSWSVALQWWSQSTETSHRSGRDQIVSGRL